MARFLPGPEVKHPEALSMGWQRTQAGLRDRRCRLRGGHDSQCRTRKGESVRNSGEPQNAAQEHGKSRVEPAGLAGREVPRYVGTYLGR